MKVFCGIDWAERHHDIALVDADGKLVAKRRIAESADGFAELMTMLADAGDNHDDPIPVAIETPRGLLVAALRETGRPIYAINPMAVARYRERHTVSRKKSDHADAMVLANILRTDAHAHRPLPSDSELARAVAALARPPRTRSGDAPKPYRNCDPCCASTTRASSPRSTAPAPPTSPAPKPARSSRSPRHRRPAPSSHRPGSRPLCGGLAASGASNHWPPAFMTLCGFRSCGSFHWSNKPWAARRSHCWPLSTPNATTPSSSATPRPRPSSSTPITQ